MEKEITQEERLDLTDEKIRAEKLAYSIELFKNLEAITKGSAIIDVKGLYAENQRLKEQNKKLIKTLKKYANDKNWRFDSITGFHTVYQGGEFDDEVHEGFRDARITLIEMGKK